MGSVSNTWRSKYDRHGKCIFVLRSYVPDTDADFSGYVRNGTDFTVQEGVADFHTRKNFSLWRITCAGMGNLIERNCICNR